MAKRPQPEIAAMRRGLLRWVAEQGRDLPWRNTRDPWAVLVSELMLQQTQVARVVPRYLAFLDHFPTPAACAAARRADVVRAWHGLGYNRRAVFLHRCATRVVDEHDGKLPDDLDALLRLPGVGPYTARAVLAFAFERDVAVVDTNVGRIAARLAGSRLTTTQAQAAADSLVPPRAGWQWNQAMLDLGATVCTKRAPSCRECPVHMACRWRGRGPDPAHGSAATTSPQSTFEGSDRQGRGRLVSALRVGPVALAAVPDVVGWDDVARVRVCIDSLRADGLVTIDDGVVALVGA
ncbi:MAG: A/G-specific adenine glycosylase [Acidimicrobiia bacterium]|nr:A/G-specific adenine glycosylase [Acidimicrobiia bacterium]